MGKETAKSPYIRYIDAKAARLTEQDNIRHWKAQQEALRDALRLNMTDGEALPAEMAADLCFAMSQVASGHEHQLLTPQRLRGSPGQSFTETECIIEAVRYIRAAKAKIIKDHRPIITVNEAFGGEEMVRRRTIQTWSQKFTSVQPLDVKTELIEPLMMACGRIYARYYGTRAPERGKSGPRIG